MKYQLINHTLGNEPQIVETIIEDKIAKDVTTDEYKVEITLVIKDTESLADDFQRKIIVISHNKQTGYEVDKQRAKEIDSFLNSINK